MLIPPSVGSSSRSMKFSTRHARVSSSLRLDEEEVSWTIVLAEMQERTKEEEEEEEKRKSMCVCEARVHHQLWTHLRGLSSSSSWLCNEEWRDPCHWHWKRMESSDCCRFGRQTRNGALRVWRWDLYVYDDKSTTSDHLRLLTSFKYSFVLNKI